MGQSEASLGFSQAGGEKVLSVALVILWTFALGSYAQGTNSIEEEEEDDGKCEAGLIIPVWKPQDDLSTGDRLSRGLVYFLALIYLFIGVAILSYRLMASVEAITTKEKKIQTKGPNGSTHLMVVRIKVWNETVVNLTLIALGSVASDILLTLVEIYSENFESGDLGPGTVVSSAAFNLLIPLAVCVYVVPKGQVRKIKNFRVFAATAAWSIFAYLWLLVILKYNTPGVVDLSEGLITVLFFPASVISSYLVDRSKCCVNKRATIVEEDEDRCEMDKLNAESKWMDIEEGFREFEESRRDATNVLRRLRKEHPKLDAYELEQLARKEMLKKRHKSRAFYRMLALTRLLGCGQNMMKKILEKDVVEPSILDRGASEEGEEKESPELKNTIDRLAQFANVPLFVDASWKEQFLEIITVSARHENEEDPTCGNYVLHFFTIFWKIVSAFVPPTGISGGYLTFVVSILAIGMLMAVVRDLESHLGCTVGLKDAVTASFGLGNLIPDLFASKLAATQEEYADASVGLGIITGVNTANVLIGIGISWTMTAIYHEFLKTPNAWSCPKLLQMHPTCFKFYVDPGSLAYSTTVFCSVSVVALAILLVRRHKSIGGELGGPIKTKIATSFILFFLWLVYLFMTSLEAYGVVEGF